MNSRERRGPRLFLDRELTPDSIRLDGSEAHYLGHVLRIKRGDSVLLFNGRGEERWARVDRLTRRDARLDVTARVEPLPESSLELTIVQAITKSDAMDWIVQKATELGVRRILPALSAFSVVKLDATRAERRVRHWRRVAQSACEQCGRHAPPILEPPAPLADCLAAIPAGHLKLLLDPRARLSMDALAAKPTGVCLAIGPEGGFDERDLASIEESAFQRVRLGPRTLRAETAALVGCAVAQARWGDLGGSGLRP